MSDGELDLSQQSQESESTGQESRAESKRYRTVNGKSVDLHDMVPLNMGDIRRLKKAGVSIMEIGDTGKADEEQLFQFALIMAQKANSEITEADVETMTLEDCTGIFQDVAAHVDQPDPSG